MNKREFRVYNATLVEKRADGQPAVPMITGYAAVFDSETVIGGKDWGFREKVAKGAFTDALKISDVRALFNHEEEYVLGRTKSGTLRLTEDDHGLKVEIDPPDTQDARDLMTKMQRGDIDQMSFAFTMEGGIQIWDETGDMPLRVIEKVGELLDVSIVTYPAYPDTECAARSYQEAKRSKNFQAASLRIRRRMDLEQKLRSTAR